MPVGSAKSRRARRVSKRKKAAPLPPDVSPALKKPSARIDFDVPSSDASSSGRGGERIDSDAEDSDLEIGGRRGAGSGESEGEEDEEEKETADEKRIRLAREYLRRAEAEEAAGGSSDEGSSGDESAASDETPASDVAHDASQASASASARRHDRMSEKLARARLSRTGGLSLKLASAVSSSVSKLWKSLPAQFLDAEAQSKAFVERGMVRMRRGHDLTVTAAALRCEPGEGEGDGEKGGGEGGGAVAYSGSKDGSVIMWDVAEGRKVHTVVPRWKPHRRGDDDENDAEMDAEEEGKKGAAAGVGERRGSEVLSLAASDDGRYLAVGRRDASVRVFDVRQRRSPATGAQPEGQRRRRQRTQPRPPKLVRTFLGHKSAVSALTFRPRSLDLLSGSDDRTLRLWNLGEMTHMETLYGHQAPVTAVSCPPKRERPVSAGRDRTVRAWKLAEETHLIYRPGGNASSADCVRCVDDNWFLSGHDDGSLRLWTADKRKPAAVAEEAHGRTDAGLVRGVSCVDVIPRSDLAVTGSCDGYLRLWRVRVEDDDKEKGVEPIGKVPLWGYVNDVKLGPGGRYAVCAVGQEPRLGRWDRVARARNRFAVVTLRTDEKEGEDNEEEEGRKKESESGSSSEEGGEGSDESESESEDEDRGQDRQGGGGNDSSEDEEQGDSDEDYSDSEDV